MIDRRANILSKVIDKIEEVERSGQGEIRILVKNHSVFKVDKTISEIFQQAD